MEKHFIYFAFFILSATTVAKAESRRSVLSENGAAGDPTSVQAEDFIPFPSFLNSDAVDFHFPNYTMIPSGLHFSCHKREPGYYANPSTECQIYHHCLPDGRSYTFMCGVGTIFNQRSFICDHWYNYNCADAEVDYKYNSNLYKEFLQPDNDLEEVVPETSLEEDSVIVQKRS